MENVYAEKLRVGDIITLEHAKPYEGFLSVETVINSECVLKTCNIALEDCLWQVCVQHQYSSTVEYEAALINEDEDKDSDNEENVEEQISKQNSSPAAESTSKALLLSKSEQKKNQLQRAAATENKLNKKLMSMKYGKPVAFGEVIQLLNIKSQTFLTVSSTMLARQERENLQVYFDGTGNTMSWLEFMPRFKYGREGQQIPNETETYIRVHERSSEYIHAARKASKYAVNNAKEINCSLESSCWKISIYSKASDAMTKNILLGNLVTLQEPEASTYLTLDSRKDSNCANVVMSSSMQLSFSASDCNVGTNLLWMLEGEDMFQGGVVSNHGSNIALRDLNSGLYMKMSEGGVTAVKNREECSFFELSTSQPADIGSSIADGTIVQLSCQKEFVGLKKSQNGKLHCEGCADRSSALSMVVTSKLQQTMGVELFTCVDTTKILKTLHFLLQLDRNNLPLSVSLAKVREIMLFADYMEAFMTPEHTSVLYDDGRDQTSNRDLAKAELATSGAAAHVIHQTAMKEQGVLDALLDLIELTSPLYLQHKNAVSSPEIVSRKRSANRGLADISAVRKRESEGEDGKSTTKFLGQNAHVPLCIEVNEFSLRLLFLCISKNHCNQVHISDRFPVLLELVKDSPLAVTCVEEMIRDNPQILQTKIRDREIKIFLKMLLESEFNSTLLNLLRSTCSCHFGVDSTQRMVAEALYSHGTESEHVSFSYGGRSDDPTILTWSESSPMYGFSLLSKSSFNMNTTKPTVISIVPRYDARRRAQWSNIQMYLSSNELIASNVPGVDLIRKGLPRIFLSWQSHDFSISTVYNRNTDDIPIELINLDKSLSTKARDFLVKDRKHSSVNYNLSKHNSSRKLIKKKSGLPRLSRTATNGAEKSASEKAIMISEYFVAQIFLAADLCLDRNYVSMGLLEKSFPYPVLLSFMKIPTLNRKIKAAVCRMIRCLYVDREPQLVIKYPRLIKTTSSCSGDEESNESDDNKDNDDLGKTMPPSYYRFGVLQIIISEFLQNDLDATQCDELSSEMMTTLLDLMRFGFYDTTKQLQDVIPPLVLALDDHFMNRGRDSKKNNSTKKSSILIIQEKVGHAKSLFDKRDKGSENKQEDNSPDGTNSSSHRVNVNFRHSRRTLNEAMHISLSKSKNISPDSIVDATRRSLLASSAQEKNSLIDIDMNKTKLELSILEVLESLPALAIILSIVVFATVFSTVQILTDQEQNSSTYIFELSISFIFFLELAIRSYCYFIVYKELTSFVAQPLNVLDILLVAFDVCLISFDSTVLGKADGATSYAKTLKILRILRLIRVFRAARLLKRISERSAVANRWEEPTRYHSTTVNEVRTIAGILKILSIIHLKIQDRKLSTALQAFVEWSDSDRNEFSDDDKSTPREVYDRLMTEDNLLTNAFPKHFDSTLLDILMYSDSELAQEGLNLLLLHKSQEELLFHNMKKMQIIYTDRMELKYVEISEILKKVSRLAEAFEIWANLETPQEISVAEMTLQAIEKVITFVKVETPLTTINLASSLQVDAEVQLLLLNVNVVDTILSLQFALLDASQAREGVNKRHPLVLRIIRACNDLLELFVYKNPANQAAAFKHFDWFLSQVDENVNSSKVVRAIVSGNRNLIKQCPKKHLAEFIQKIAVNGQKAEYLDLFVGLTDIEDSGDSSISFLRNEISRYVTNTEKSSHMLMWCCSRRSKAYEARVNAMEPYVDLNEPPRDIDLSPELQYHINLLQLLVGCKLGPKLQAVYPLDDVIVAILDPRTVFNVKRTLGILLLEMFESNISGLECSEHVWLFVDDCIEMFEETNEELSQPRRTAAFSCTLKQRCEWMNICLTILTIFFKDFDFVVFNDDDIFAEDSITQITQRSEEEVRTMMNTLFTQISILREKCISNVNKPTLQIIDSCLSCWDSLIDETQGDDSEYTTRLKKKSQSALESKNEKCRRPSVVAEIQQIYYRKHFHDFVKAVQDTKVSSSAENVSTDIFERLPSFYDPQSADLRLEPFLLKVASHFRNNINRTQSARALDQSHVDSAAWMIQTLKMILNRVSGVNRNNVFDLAVDQQEVEFTYYNLVMNDYGIVYLCMDLIAVGIDDTLCVEAVDLLVMLLCKSSGRTQIQHNVQHYLAHTDSTLFFEKVKDLLEQLMLWCERYHSSRASMNATNMLKSDIATQQLPNDVTALLLLCNMTADNYSPNKLLLHTQEGNIRFVNILDHIAHFLDVLSRLEGPMCTKMAIQLTHLIITLLKGPDHTIQEHFVIRTDMLLAVNRFMRMNRPAQDMTEYWSKDFDTLKEYFIDVLRAFIEGQASNSVIVERVQTTIEISILNMLILPVETDDYGNSLEIRNLSRMQAKYVVFLQSLADCHSELPYNAMESINEDTACVEVLWKGNLTKHYFHIPELAKNLSENSKVKLTDGIEFSTQEKKLKDFLRKAKELHREAEHQQLFKSFGVVHLWSWKTLIAKVMFINCLIMNGLMTGYYTANPNANPEYNNRFNDPIFGFDIKDEVTAGKVDFIADERFLATSTSITPSNDDVSLPSNIYDAVHALSAVHIALSVLAYNIILVVQVPLLYSAYIDKGRFRITSVLLALLNPVPLWYFLHTVVSLEAYSRSPLFLSLLLLQFIAVDSASNEVMLAVIYPFRQLFTTLVIIGIFIHIFASTIFVFFREEFINLECSSMWQSFKLMISYGFRSEEGIGRYMEDTIGIRIIVDVTFYFIIVVILRNIFFGVIIDTFGELRSEKVERKADSNSRCFICGVDQNEFDKKAAAHQDFKMHRSKTHHIWNYLFLTMKIWKQKPNQDTSLEKYLRQCLHDDDVSWFPVGIIGIEEGEARPDKFPITNSKDDRADAPLSKPIQYGVGDNFTTKDDIDSQLEHIQASLGKLSTVQAKNRSTLLATEELNKSEVASAEMDNETKRLIEKVVREEVKPISMALEDAMRDVNVLLQRLQALSASKKTNTKFITMSPKK